MKIEKDKVIILGKSGIGKSTIVNLTKDQSIIIDNLNDPTITVNNIEYQEISSKENLAVRHAINVELHHLPDNINILEEFNLIQHKLSNLSRSKRIGVEKIFHLTHKVKETE